MGSLCRLDDVRADARSRRTGGRAGPVRRAPPTRGRRSTRPRRPSVGEAAVDRQWNALGGRRSGRAQRRARRCASSRSTTAPDASTSNDDAPIGSTFGPDSSPTSCEPSPHGAETIREPWRIDPNWRGAELDLDRVTHDVGVVRRAFAGRNADAVGASPCVDLGVVLEACPDPVRRRRERLRRHASAPRCRRLRARADGKAQRIRRARTATRRRSHACSGSSTSGFGAVNVERELHSFAGYGEQRRQMRRLEQRLGWRLLGAAQRQWRRMTRLRRQRTRRRP